MPDLSLSLNRTGELGLPSTDPKQEPVPQIEVERLDPCGDDRTLPSVRGSVEEVLVRFEGGGGTVEEEEVE